MKIVTGFRPSTEGRAAVDRAIEEARLRDGTVLVVHSMRGGERDELEQVMNYRKRFEELKADLEASGVDHELIEYARGNSPAEDLLAIAREREADLIVIGIRRRSPVGKLVLGSNAQDVLLEADCPVLAVKSAASD
jgi:nucleotide-binding universal stress UspA family protein